MITRDINEHSESNETGVTATMDSQMVAVNVQNDENESNPATPPYQSMENGEDWGYETVTQYQIEAVARMEESVSEEDESDEEGSDEESDKENQVPDID